MTLKPDIVVCNPQASSDRGKAVFVHFEIMNPVTFEATGKFHTIALPHADALSLFGMLEVMARDYGWSTTEPPAIVEIPVGNSSPRA
jgi:hypothetical protein